MNAAEMIVTALSQPSSPTADVAQNVEEQPQPDHEDGIAQAQSPPVPAPALRGPRQLRLLEVGNPLTARLGAEFFRSLPEVPGVYFFYDSAGRLLYIGQSENLRARVGSYRHVTPEKNVRRTLRLVGRIARVEWRVCETAAAAIELERVLLLEHRPPFNRAGVWQGPPWWLRVEAQGEWVELRLRRGEMAPAAMADRTGLTELDSEDEAPGEWTGPLPAGFRHVHGSLLRWVFRWLHPERAPGEYPHGLFNLTVPLRVRLPVGPGSREMNPEALARMLRGFALGDGTGEEVMAYLEAVAAETAGSETTTLDRQEAPPGVMEEYWLQELETLRKFAGRWVKEGAGEGQGAAGIFMAP